MRVCVCVCIIEAVQVGIPALNKGRNDEQLLNDVRQQSSSKGA
jgi:hypothetical protein